MKKKVLLMGMSGSGKTSMRSIIFANYIASDTKRLGATIEVEHSHVRFLGNLVLNLWDCGGQQSFIESYFQNYNIFQNVEVLIYVFDIENRAEKQLKKDMKYYKSCLRALYDLSPNARVFCLLHKMDLVEADKKNKIFVQYEDELMNISKPFKCVCFKTSIWDETLFSAWSSIIYLMMPNVQKVEQSIKKLADLLECDEILLFERSTFLIVTSCERVVHHDKHRSEKVSSIIKKFKLSCSKMASQFISIELKHSNFVAFMDVFTSNTYIMVIVSDLTIQTAAISLNIKNARKYFEKFEYTTLNNVIPSPLQPNVSTIISTAPSTSTRVL